MQHGQTRTNTDPLRGDRVERVLYVRRVELRPSPLQVRTQFDAQYLSELGLNIRNNGIVQPLVVRLWSGGADASYPEAKWEIVAGECRWRGTEERLHPDQTEYPGEMMPAVERVPVLVRELTDTQVLETMLSENAKRKNLTVIEECEAFHRLLNEEQAPGVKYTIAAIARKIGFSSVYVTQRLKLKKLSSRFRASLVMGTVSFEVARKVAACPESVIARVEDEVLNPKKYAPLRLSKEPLSYDELHEVIHTRYVRELRGAPFALDREDLVPETRNEHGERTEGGRCLDCPWNTSNGSDEKSERDRSGSRGGRTPGDGRFCVNPACFAKKQEVNVLAARVKASEQGARVLSPAEVAEVFHDNGTMRFDSGYVELDAKPAPDELAPGLKKVPTWENIVTGTATARVVVDHAKDGSPVMGDVQGAVDVPVVIAVDGKGRVHHLVERSVALEAARKNGNDAVLSTAGGRGLSLQEQDLGEKRKADAEKQRARSAVSLAIMGALVDAIIADPFAIEIGDLTEVALRHAGNAGLMFVRNRRGLDPKGDVEQVVRKHLASLRGPARDAMILELLLAEDWAWHSGPKSAEVVPVIARELLEVHDIDVKAIEKRTLEELGGKKKRRGKAEEGKDERDGKDQKGAAPAGSGFSAPVTAEETGLKIESFKVTVEQEATPHPPPPKRGKKKQRQMEERDARIAEIRAELKRGEVVTVPSLQVRYKIGWKAAESLLAAASNAEGGAK